MKATVIRRYAGRALFAGAVLAGICAPLAALAQASNYPSRPIKLIVPFPPGGTSDLVGRITAEALSKELGQPVFVENIGGAGGSIGARAMANAAPDGYTLGIGTTSTHGTNSAVYKTLPYDAVTGFTPITKLISAPGVIAVNPSFPAKNYDDFVKLLKANPGKFSYASSGLGGATHLAMEYFKAVAGVNVVHIPYKGSGPAITDTIAGQVPMLWDTLSSSLQHIQSGKLVAIAVAFPTRSPQLPNVPTFAEAGLKNYDAEMYNGLFAPPNLPKDILEKIHAAMIRALRKPEVIAKYESIGASVVGNSSSVFADEIREEVAKWKRVASFGKVSLD